MFNNSAMANPHTPTPKLTNARKLTNTATPKLTVGLQVLDMFNNSAMANPSEYGTYKPVKARFWSWPPGDSRWNLLSCSVFAR